MARKILSWFGESVKSRRARYDASGTPAKVKTVINRYKKRLGIFTFTATLEFHTFCSHYETVITINTGRYFHRAYHRKTTNSRYFSRDSWLFVWESAVSALLKSDVWCHSMSQNGPYFPFGSADWARVCFDLQLALLRKNCLLKNLDHVQPKLDLA